MIENKIVKQDILYERVSISITKTSFLWMSGSQPKLNKTSQFKKRYILFFPEPSHM